MFHAGPFASVGVPDHVTTVMWLLLLAAWLPAAALFLRARRRPTPVVKADSLSNTRAARAAIAVAPVLTTACVLSVVVPILDGAPWPVLLFWLLAIPPAIELLIVAWWAASSAVLLLIYARRYRSTPSR